MPFKAYVVHRSIIYAQQRFQLRPPFFLFHKYSLVHTRQLARAKFVAANLRIVYHTERVLWSLEQEKNRALQKSLCRVFPRAYGARC